MLTLPRSLTLPFRSLGLAVALAAAACGAGSTASELAEASGEDPGVDREAGADTQRIVSLSGTLTELLFATGLGGQIVGVDVTSTYPADALTDVPRLGHTSQLNVEGVLDLQPDLVLVDSAAASTSEVFGRLTEAGVRVLAVPSGTHLSNAVTMARRLAPDLGIAAPDIEALAATVARDSVGLADYLAARTAPGPRTLFLYARGAGRIMVGGSGTAAAAMIRHAGATNAAAAVDEFANLTPESVVAADPEALLLFSSGLESLDGAAGLAAVPGLAATRALRDGRVVAMDGHYLLGFGPRAAAAALELAQRLRGETSSENLGLNTAGPGPGPQAPAL